VVHLKGEEGKSLWIGHLNTGQPSPSEGGATERALVFPTDSSLFVPQHGVGVITEI
jgi:hypothetical protein